MAGIHQTPRHSRGPTSTSRFQKVRGAQGQPQPLTSLRAPASNIKQQQKQFLRTAWHHVPFVASPRYRKVSGPTPLFPSVSVVSSKCPTGYRCPQPHLASHAPLGSSKVPLPHHVNEGTGRLRTILSLTGKSTNDSVKIQSPCLSFAGGHNIEF